MSRGTLTCLSQTGEGFHLTFGLGRQDVNNTCLSQTGEGFLLTFDLGRQDVNNKNNHGIGQINHGSTTEWINHGAGPQKLQTTS